MENIMRVIDPKQRERQRHNRHRPRKSSLLLLLIAVGAVVVVLLLKTRTSNAPVQQAVNNTLHQNITTPAKKGTLKNFTGQQFKELYENFAYPNTALINEHTPITGNEQADARIRTIAVQRGYKLKSAPVTNAFIDVGEGFKLQQRAAQPWLDLQAAAKKDGLNFGLTAAYRSADEQKQLFNERLARTNIPVSGIASGAYDAQLSQVLRMTAIPGYSRHHTGYTIDIACKDQSTTSFEYTKCFDWLGADNYKNAKTHGWIPSYPGGAKDQGPDPEPWEYVWVGTDAVTD
jgi:LAS superfamily LD-carboxypeptidase LdcB